MVKDRNHFGQTKLSLHTFLHRILWFRACRKVCFIFHLVFRRPNKWSFL